MKITKFTIIILLLGIICVGIIIYASQAGRGGAAIPGGSSGVSSVSTGSSSNTSAAAFKACQQELAAAATTDGFATGTILVAFTSTTTWPEAEAALSDVGASTTQTIEDFSVNGIIQGNVLPGEEITTACTLRANPAVRYAGLNTLFTLAQ